MVRPDRYLLRPDAEEAIDRPANLATRSLKFRRPRGRRDTYEIGSWVVPSWVPRSSRRPSFWCPRRRRCAFSDVPPSYWDYTAIQYVGSRTRGCRTTAPQSFQPKTSELRKYLARSLVTIYAPNEPTDPNIKIVDVPPTRPVLAVRQRRGEARLDAAVQERQLRPGAEASRWRASTGRSSWRSKLTGPVAGLQNIHMADGTKYTVSGDLPLPPARPGAPAPLQPLGRDDGHRIEPS